jgi:hypothetical protein
LTGGDDGVQLQQDGGGDDSLSLGGLEPVDLPAGQVPVAASRAALSTRHQRRDSQIAYALGQLFFCDYCRSAEYPTTAKFGEAGA